MKEELFYTVWTAGRSRLNSSKRWSGDIFTANWNNHHNHRICSTNGRLPSMVKRTVLILFTATKRIKKTCVILCQPLLTISGGEGWKKRLQNAQPQKGLLRSNGDWGVPQQAASGKVDSQKHRLPLSLQNEKSQRGNRQISLTGSIRFNFLR